MLLAPLTVTLKMVTLHFYADSIPLSGFLRLLYSLAGHPVILCDNPIDRDSKSWAPGAQLQLLFAVCLTENQVPPGPQAPHLSSGVERESSDTSQAGEGFAHSSLDGPPGHGHQRAAAPRA